MEWRLTTVVVTVARRVGCVCVLRDSTLSSFSSTSLSSCSVFMLWTPAIIIAGACVMDTTYIIVSSVCMYVGRRNRSIGGFQLVRELCSLFFQANNPGLFCCVLSIIVVVALTHTIHVS